MTPATLNLVTNDDQDLAIYKGDYYTFTATFPVDLTGYTDEKAQIRTQKDQAADDDPLAEFSITITPGALTSDVEFVLAEVVTDDLPVTTTAVWDFEMVDPDGHKQTHLAGSVTIAAPVTVG